MQKHWCNSGFQIFLYRKYIKTAKNGGFCEKLLNENDFEAVLVNFSCYEHDVNASETVQKISTRALLELCQLTKTDNFKSKPMRKHIEQFIICLLEIQASCLIFSWQTKMSSLLHVGLISIISKVFTILCILCLCRNI